MRRPAALRAVVRRLRSLPAALFVAALTAAAITAAPLGEVEPPMALGTNYYGGDISVTVLQVPDPGLCRQACDQNGQCRGWTFVKPGAVNANAVCALKGQLGQPSADQNTISAAKGATTYTMSPGARVEAWMGIGADLPGSDLENTLLDRGDPSLCAARCEANGSCQAWTFMKPGVWNAKAICWLKRSVPNPVGNGNTISARRQTAAPVAASTEWGVWASASGGAWNDPCAIQYNAAAIAGNRYDGDPRNYRRVRTRASQREADVDINEFSRFFKNKPDGVVKMTPCGSGTVVPTVSGVIPPAGTGFGVWAYVVGVANRSDPCSWQYVAAAIPGNRYDNDTNYVRVRARMTMEDASNDVTFFSAFMQDQPDGVAKLRPCSQATQLLPPRPGGPGVVAVKFGVWAYTVGTASMSDPCAIQYVKAALPKYDGVPRYVRVAEVNSDSEASNLVTRFSAFMEDKPDGVVKLRPCHQPQGDYATWMTGRFNTNFGTMTLTPGGGSYDFDGGTLSVTKIEGPVMEGRWNQVSKGGCGNVHGGRFRFVFTEGGFNGTWGHCDDPLNQGAWFGTRQK